MHLCLELLGGERAFAWLSLTSYESAKEFLFLLFFFLKNQIITGALLEQNLLF